MKVILFGKNGMLGQAFMEKLQGFEVFAYGREDLDITDYEKMKEVFDEVKPDFVINCAALANVDQCELEPEKAMKINGEAVGEMAKFGGTLVQISTDYVFDGGKDEGYKEDEAVNPVNIYGKSKVLAEELIAKNCKQFFVVRSSLLYGEGGENFVSKTIAAAKRGEKLSMTSELKSCPTYCADLAQAVIDYFLKSEREYGIYHVVNSGALTRYDLTKKILEIAGINAEVEEVAADFLKRPARRPKKSVLLNTKLPPLRGSEEALKVYIK